MSSYLKKELCKYLTKELADVVDDYTGNPKFWHPYSHTMDMVCECRFTNYCQNCAYESRPPGSYRIYK